MHMRLSVFCFLILIVMFVSNGTALPAANFSVVTRTNCPDIKTYRTHKIILNMQNKDEQQPSEIVFVKSQPDELEMILESKPYKILEGDMLKLLQISYDAFKSDVDIPSQKKDLKNYKIEFRQDKRFWYVLFDRSEKANDKLIKGGSTELTKTVLYIIRKEDYKLITSRFFK